VEDLIKCHGDKPVAKFFGACNDAKTAMDQCFAGEKVARRDANFAKSRKDAAALGDWKAERAAASGASER
jgi:hypothetical protein